MLQQTYAVALWYLFYKLPVVHTDNSSSETVPDNDSSAITDAFGNKSKHARSSGDCKRLFGNSQQKRRERLGSHSTQRE